MISWHDLYTVLAAMVPLYVAMILAYGSVRWWKIFTPDQCSGINRFVAVFAVPLLSFHFISTNNPYEMNFRFIAADSLQKLIILILLFIYSHTPFFKHPLNGPGSGSLEWGITIFSLSTLPNTLVMGIPLLIAMYGPYSGSLMVQVVVLQCIIWYTLLLFLYEYRGAKLLITEQFPETAGSIVSLRVDSDVVSLDGREFLETDAEIGGDGRLHVTVRKSSVSRRSLGGGGGGMTPRASNMTGAEIYSLSSSRNPTPRGSNFNTTDLYYYGGGSGFHQHSGRPSSFGLSEFLAVQSNVSRGPTPRPSNFDDHGGVPGSTNPVNSYPVPNPEFGGELGKSSVNGGSSRRIGNSSSKESGGGGIIEQQKQRRSMSDDAKEFQMLVWSSTGSSVSEVGGMQVFGGGGGNNVGNEVVHSGRSISDDKEIGSDPHTKLRSNNEGELCFRGSGGGEEYCFPRTEEELEDGDNHHHGLNIGLSKLGSGLTTTDDPKQQQHGVGEGGGSAAAGKAMPPASVMTRLILIMVWRKLIRNPNTYSSLIGLIWSLIAFRWNVEMPSIIKGSISILSDAGLGMAMFSLGLFMALQPKVIACGNSMAGLSMLIRFVAGPAVMAISSFILGLKGDLLRVAIVQAALPQGIVPFVFAKEYNNHPAILSTAVIFGMLVALPIDLLYYILLGL